MMQAEKWPYATEDEV